MGVVANFDDTESPARRSTGRAGRAMRATDCAATPEKTS